MESAFKLFSQNWTLDGREKRQLQSLADPDTCTVSALIRDYLDTVRNALAEKNKRVGCASLQDMIVRRLQIALREMDSPEETLTDALRCLADRRPAAKAFFTTLPYPLLRRTLHLAAESHEVRQLVSSIPELRDLDEQILACEEGIREFKDTDGLHLVTIKDFTAIMKREVDLYSDPGPSHDDILFSRKDVGFNQFPLLDEYRHSSVCICASDAWFQTRLVQDRPEFQGLDYSNMILTGDLVLGLLCNPHGVDDCAAEIRIFGLDADAATAKVQQLHRQMALNVPEFTDILRGPDQVLLYNSDSLSQRVRIPLKVWRSRTDALMDIAFDPCALGFDGSQILMLPRCARAIETGYFILTTKLVFNEPGLCPPLAREKQILAYSERGFGLRILPAYTRFLERKLQKSDDLSRTNMPWSTGPPHESPADKFGSLESYRRLGRDECGLKTLRRIAFLGQDLANRIFISQFDEEDAPFATSISLAPGGVEIEYTDARQKMLAWLREPKNVNDLFDDDLVLPETQLEHISSFQVLGYDLLQRPFEALLRCCEANRQGLFTPLPKEWQTQLGLWSDQLDYEPEVASEYHACVNDANNRPFNHFVVCVVNHRTGGTYSTPAYREYLTGRIRLAVVSRDFTHLLTAQRLSLPMLIPADAENELSKALPTNALSPICRASAHVQGSDYTGGIPFVTERQDESGNMRYLHIEPQTTLWKGFDDLQDEAIDIARIVSNMTALINSQLTCDDTRLAADLRDILCCRKYGMLPQVDDQSLVPGTMIRLKEAILFKAWALAMPKSSRENPGPGTQSDVDVNYRYPVPDELFWGPESEESIEDRVAKRARIDKTSDFGSRWGFSPKAWWFREEAYEDVR